MSKIVTDRPNFNRANFAPLNEKIAIEDWSDLQEGDLEVKYNQFKMTLDRLVHSCVPRARPKSAKKNIYSGPARVLL